MCIAEELRLFDLLNQRLSDPLVCYPQGVQLLGRVKLFVFQRCCPPPEISFVRQKAVLYV